jgi:hypothetical protein
MKAREEQYDSHATIKYYMLSFAGCSNNHITQRYDKQHEYAKVKYDKYVGKGMYAT